MLDLSGLSNVADGSKIDGGVWINLVSLKKDEDGTPLPLFLNDDPTKPRRALVRSYRCKAVREAEDRLRRTGFVRISKAKGKDRDNALADATNLPPAKRFALLLVKLENCGAVPGVQDVSDEDALAIFNNSDLCWLVDQVNECAYDDERYLSATEIADLKRKDDAAGEKKPPAEAA